MIIIAEIYHMNANISGRALKIPTNLDSNSSPHFSHKLLESLDATCITV